MHGSVSCTFGGGLDACGFAINLRVPLVLEKMERQFYRSFVFLASFVLTCVYNISLFHALFDFALFSVALLFAFLLAVLFALFGGRKQATGKRVVAGDMPMTPVPFALLCHRCFGWLFRLHLQLEYAGTHLQPPLSPLSAFVYRHARECVCRGVSVCVTQRHTRVPRACACLCVEAELDSDIFIGTCGTYAQTSPRSMLKNSLVVPCLGKIGEHSPIYLSRRIRGDP